MKKVLRITCLLIALVMALGLMAGCVGSGGGDEAPADDGGEAAPAEGGGEDAGGEGGGDTLYYSSMWNESEPQAIWLKGLAEAFEAETGTRLEISWVGRDVLNQVKTQILGDNAPDLVDQDHSELSGALLTEDEQMIMPLTDLLNGPGPEGEATFKEVFREGLIDMYTFQGEDYFVPYNFITSGFYYNKNLWAEVGVEAPSTWDEFIAAGEAFEAAGYDFLAGDNDPMYNEYWIYWTLQRMVGAGKFLEAAQDPTGAAWDDPKFLEAAEHVAEVSKSGKNFYQEGYEGAVWPAGQNDFALGNQAANLCGTWIPVELKDMVDADWEWGYFPFPTIDGGVGKVTDMEAYQIGFCIPNGAKNPDKAKEFLLFISTHDNALGLVEDALCMHARSDMPMPEVLADVGPYLDAAESFHLVYDGVPSWAPQWNVDVLYPNSDALFHGEVDAATFIENIKAASIAFYENK